MAIYDYVSEDSPEAASRLHDRIATQVGVLLQQPLIGRRSHRVPGTRELVISGAPYIAFYRVDAEPQPQLVEILNVVHTARQWPPHISN